MNKDRMVELAGVKKLTESVSTAVDIKGLSAQLKSLSKHLESALDILDSAKVKFLAKQEHVEDKVVAIEHLVEKAHEELEHVLSQVDLQMKSEK